MVVFLRQGKKSVITLKSGKRVVSTPFPISRFLFRIDRKALSRFVNWSGGEENRIDRIDKQNLSVVSNDVLILPEIAFRRHLNPFVQ
jgi:hypothetical protein